MQHVAIDLGGRESQICVRRADGTIVWEGRRKTAQLKRVLTAEPKSRVILETSSEAFKVADQALDAGHEVRVVPATLVRSLGVGERGIKTDLRDARKLSEVSTRIDLPSVHIPSRLSRQLKALCVMREQLVDARTQLVNGVRGFLRTQIQGVRTGRVTTFPRRVRDRLLALEEGLPSFVERNLQAIEALSEQIEAADAELATLAKDNEIARRLMTMPGVGPVTAIRFVAAVDRVERFENPHALESYFGLTPGECSSSDRQRRTGITKAGSPKMRWALTQAAWAMRIARPNDPLVLWAEQIAERRGTRIATIALARRMAGILFAMWRDGTSFNASHPTLRSAA